MAKFITEHEALDRLLKYLHENRGELLIHSYRIWQDVFPDQKEQVVYSLLKKLMNHDDLVNAQIREEELRNFEGFFEATDLTEMFLRQGGFTRDYEKKTRAMEEAAKNRSFE
jgi:hypothetical protein